MEAVKFGVTLCASTARFFEYDTCWHLVRHKHKLLSPHTNVKHPSSWIHARAPAESHINDASLPSPVSTNLRGWGHVICNATLPPWVVLKLWLAVLYNLKILMMPILQQDMFLTINCMQLPDTYHFILSVSFSMKLDTPLHQQKL